MKQKSRKTKKEKIVASERRQRSEGFVIKQEWLSTKQNTTSVKLLIPETERKYFKTDLTKTLILTMLVLALELALWQYLSRH